MAQDMQVRPPRLSGSPWEENLIDLLESHIRNEGKVLRSYEDLAKDSGDRAIEYLVGVILEDERRHHTLLSDMLNNFRSDVEWRDVGPSVPQPSFRTPPNQPELLIQTKRLLDIEREDARALRLLKRELQPVTKTTLFTVLVELMQADTAKHVSILKRIQTLLRRPIPF